MAHETLMVRNDPLPVTEEQIEEGLSQLGDSCSRHHAYVRCGPWNVEPDRTHNIITYYNITTYIYDR